MFMSILSLKHMKKSSGKPSRISGFIPSDKKRDLNQKGKHHRRDKKKSRKWILALLLLLLLGTAVVVIYNIPKGNNARIDPLMGQNGMSGPKEKELDTQRRSTANIN